MSYRRADASWPTQWLADRLAGQFGAGVVFQDVDSIRPGDDFAAEIQAAVGSCLVLLAVIGPQWLAKQGDGGRRVDDPNDWVRLEIEAALQREILIIPVLVDGARMPKAAELPPSLQSLTRRQAVTLSRDSLDVRRLVSVLETVLAQEASPVGQDGTPMRRPAQSQISRLLLSAFQDAAILTGTEKVGVLSAIIRAAVLAAPERVRRLVDDAETTARSIKDWSAGEAALGEVAAVVAAIDPERGEAIARSIGDEDQRWTALAKVAAAVAAIDPERGEAIARSIKLDERITSWRVARWAVDKFYRWDALASVAAAVAATNPGRGEAIARSIEDADRRWAALVWVAAAVAAGNPKHGEDIACSIEDADRRAEALAKVAAAVADPEHRMWLIVNAETAARAIDNENALGEVAAAVAAGDPKRGEDIARSIGSELWRAVALAKVAAAVATTDPERGKAIARSIEDASRRASALAEVAAAAAAGDAERGEDIARSIKSGFWRASALANIAHLLAQQANS